MYEFKAEITKKRNSTLGNNKGISNGNFKLYYRIKIGQSQNSTMYTSKFP